MYRANRYLIARNTDACHDCGGIGVVIALVLPHDTQWDDGDEEPMGSNCALMPSYLTAVNPELLAQFEAQGARVRRLASRTYGGEYLANTCTHCDALRGDHYLTNPGGPFWPNHPDDPVPELFFYRQDVSASAGSMGHPIFDLGPYAEDFAGPQPPRRGGRRRG